MVGKFKIRRGHEKCIHILVGKPKLRGYWTGPGNDRRLILKSISSTRDIKRAILQGASENLGIKR
jgi:hypothetical protein